MSFLFLVILSVLAALVLRRYSTVQFYTIAGFMGKILTVILIALFIRDPYQIIPYDGPTVPLRMIALESQNRCGDSLRSKYYIISYFCSVFEIHVPTIGENPSLVGSLPVRYSSLSRDSCRSAAIHKRDLGFPLLILFICCPCSLLM
jgi:hypothetical protein